MTEFFEKEDDMEKLFHVSSVPPSTKVSLDNPLFKVVVYVADSGPDVMPRDTLPEDVDISVLVFELDCNLLPTVFTDGFTHSLNVMLGGSMSGFS